MSANLKRKTSKYSTVKIAATLAIFIVIGASFWIAISSPLEVSAGMSILIILSWFTVCGIWMPGDNAKIHPLAFQLTFVISGLLFVFFTAKMQSGYANRQLQLYGSETSGEVIDLYIRRGGKGRRSEPAARFVYIINGKSYVKSVTNRGGFIEVKDSIRIRYSTKDPRIFEVLQVKKRQKPEITEYRPVNGEDQRNDSLNAIPEFRGGMRGFESYLQNNLIYPEEGRRKGLSGKVLLSFVVEEDGTIKDVAVIKGMGYGFDEAAVQVLKHSPRWKPGLHNGKAIKVKYSLPVSFKP